MITVTGADEKTLLFSRNHFIFTLKGTLYFVLFVFMDDCSLLEFERANNTSKLRTQFRVSTLQPVQWKRELIIHNLNWITSEGPQYLFWQSWGDSMWKSLFTIIKKFMCPILKDVCILSEHGEWATKNLVCTTRVMSKKGTWTTSCREPHAWDLKRTCAQSQEMPVQNDSFLWEKKY